MVSNTRDHLHCWTFDGRMDFMLDLVKEPLATPGRTLVEKGYSTVKGYIGRLKEGRRSRASPESNYTLPEEDKAITWQEGCRIVALLGNLLLQEWSYSSEFQDTMQLNRKLFIQR